MRNIFAATVAILLVSTAWAQGNLGAAGRITYSGAVTNQVVLDLSKLNQPARLACLAVQYSGQASGSVVLVAQLNGNQYCIVSNQIVAAQSWIYQASEVWFRPDQGDKLILKSSCTNRCTVVADFAR